MAKSGGSKDGSGVAAGNPSLLSFPTRNVTVKENQKMKELSEQFQGLKDRLDKQ